MYIHNTNLNEHEGAVDERLLRRLALVRPGDQDRLRGVEHDEGDHQEAQRGDREARPRRPAARARGPVERLRRAAERQLLFLLLQRLRQRQQPL